MKISNEHTPASVLVIAPTPFFSDRGTHIRILEEARAAAAEGHAITIVTYHIGQTPERAREDGIKIKRINRLLFWYTKIEAGPDWQKLILDIMLLRKVWSQTRIMRPAILHAHLHEGVLIGWIVQRLFWWRRIKLVADFHGSLTAEMMSHSYLRFGILQRVFLWVERWIDRMGDRSIASSWEYSEQLSQVRGETVATIADGVDPAVYQTLSDQASCRTEFGLPLDKLIVTYAGALIDNKGLRYLLPAILSVTRDRPEVLFVLAGYPAAPAREFVTTHQLEAQVRVISPLSYTVMPCLLRASDVGIDPKDSSVSQASGKMLQYMAAGLPVVCFDRDNNRRYLGDGGVYCADTTGSGLADGIITCIDQIEHYRQAGLRNQARVHDFTWQASGHQLHQLYQQLITTS